MLSLEQERKKRKLEAAAPALLAALIKWERYGTDNGGEENYSFLAETRAAIAQATAT